MAGNHLCVLRLVARREARRKKALHRTLPIWTQRRDASVLNVLEASWPQAPKDSTTRGMQLQPSSSQIPEFSRILRCSVAEPAVCPASETTSGCSGDDTEIERSRFAIEAPVVN